ncbi:uncharacterized protein LOC126315301 [Schistocerca gregaria]|uniref:uncharacterized protein LOC126315301 n=1 Tax=Schistocerca gregaria TaxID=7010 RepID=UPI00211E1552|nr:uncharacterized protein LOC126315301 [Schistocerca gregaria]XP_049848497.1 uncharacterized protein LOC126315301 [Schistocerca gregaria]
MKNQIHTAKEHIQIANSLYIEDELEEALQHYNTALSLEPRSVDGYLKRSACYYNLKQNLESIEDANKAISIDSSCAEAYYRKGVALFSEKEYESARAAFNKACEIKPDAQKSRIWLNKCDAELRMEDGSSGHEPLSSPAPSEKLAEAKPAEAPKPAEAVVTGTTGKANSIKHDWYQTDTYLTINIFAKSVKPEQLEIDIQERRLVVKIHLNPPHVLDFRLDGCVVPGECRHVLYTSKVEIYLKKQYPGMWKALEETESSVSADETKKNILAYPSSRGAKNWDALKPEDEKLTGDAAVDKLFRDIYKGASDEQRRAMMKSYLESGGTVLSTNWDEVKKGKVQGSPPNGTEMRYWKDA